MKNRFSVFLLLLFAFAAVAADNDRTALNARSEWMGGFSKLEAADQTFKSNAPAALGIYKEALDVFESVRRKYPQWNPSLLNYRINYCQQKIEEIGRIMESQVNKLSSDELLELTRSQTKKIKELEAQRNELDMRVKFLSDALLRAREEAAKSSTLESTATALATARANLERKVGELEVRLKDAERKNAQLLSDNSETVKLRKEYDKTKLRADRAEEDLRKAGAELRTNGREMDKLTKTVELLTKHNDELDAALKAAKELLETRGGELADAKRKAKAAEEKLAAKERLVGSRDEELARMRNQLGARNELSGEIKEREAELSKLRKELEKERSNAVIRDEKNAELLSEVSKLRNKNHLAENENLKLNMALKEAKILQDKANSDVKNANGRLKKAEDQAKQLADTENRLKTQVELSKKQEGQLASQTKELSKLGRDNKELQAKLDESMRLSAKLQERMAVVDKIVEKIKEKGGDSKRLVDAEFEIATLREKCSQLEKGIKGIESLPVGGDADQTVARNKELEKQLLFVMNELGVKNKTIERNEQLASEREAFYKQQLHERDEMLKSYENSTMHKEWVEKLKTLNAKLEEESKKRMALEATLVDLETKLEDYEDTDKPAKGSEPKASSQSTAAQEADFRISRERERKKMVADYIRKGKDSELQNKPEAAMFNYQKALELDSDNVTALQRLGIIAARQGNDRDTVKYLKQAFRFDTDNLDTLLALGFAQARLGEASWAVAYLGRAVALSPDNAYAAKIYGSALFNLGWTQAAESQLKNAYKLDPKSPEAPYNLAVLYATADKPDFKEAAKWYKIAIANGAQRDPGLDETLK